MLPLQTLLETSSQLHRHLCPRQVLGVRMGMCAGEILNLDLPQENKRLYTIMETDGCAADGVSTATNCWVGRRTMRVEDYGKVAATFVDTKTGEAIRLVPRSDARCLARDFAPEAKNKWEAQLLGYQRMSSEMLFSVHPVQLRVPIEQILSRAGVKAICDICGEEVMNEREVIRDDMTLCRSCAGEGYYLMMAERVLPSTCLRFASFV
ncbi:MAG: TraR/DksA C4-type zinc finger protein [Chloroflexi bacterium]|nr:TraR/DksA C4-type zinc finger protein [Chloroflexota bacterium]